MNITVMFKRLGAPLANARWSWGAVRRDGTVVLRVWRDEIRKEDGKSYVRVAYLPDDRDLGVRPGFDERLEHLELVKAGARSWMVMCEAKDPKATTREIKSFDQDEVFEAGPFRDIEGAGWLEIGKPIRVTSIKFEG